MIASTPGGFGNAPVSKALFWWVAAGSIVVNVLGVKQYTEEIILGRDVAEWGQYWRLALWALLFGNQSEVLFGCIVIYNLRAVERMIGSGKYLTFIALSMLYSILLVPTVFTLWHIFFTRTEEWGVIPGGPTPVVFALLSLYQALIPRCYKLRILANNNKEPYDISDKAFMYILGAQLVISSQYPPASGIIAFVGWTVGRLIQLDVIPGLGIETCKFRFI